MIRLPRQVAEVRSDSSDVSTSEEKALPDTTLDNRPITKQQQQHQFHKNQEYETITSAIYERTQAVALEEHSIYKRTTVNIYNRTLARFNRSINKQWS